MMGIQLSFQLKMVNTSQEAKKASFFDLKRTVNKSPYIVKPFTKRIRFNCKGNIFNGTIYIEDKVDAYGRVFRFW